MKRGQVGKAQDRVCSGQLWINTDGLLGRIYRRAERPACQLQFGLTRQGQPVFRCQVDSFVDGLQGLLKLKGGLPSIGERQQGCRRLRGKSHCFFTIFNSVFPVVIYNSNNRLQGIGITVMWVTLKARPNISNCLLLLANGKVEHCPVGVQFDILDSVREVAKSVQGFNHSAVLKIDKGVFDMLVLVISGSQGKRR